MFYRTNHFIRARQVKIIDETSGGAEIISTKDALYRAQQAGLDLVEISPKAEPPICKIIDYGKFLYDQKKKVQKQKQTTIKHQTKGIQITYRIEAGDLERQQKKAIKFLEEGHDVNLKMRLRGRERLHTDVAIEKFNAFAELLKEHGRVDRPPKYAGGQITALLKTLKKK